jgi:hypothetical protein
VRVYKHRYSPTESLTLVSTALVGESLAVDDVNWSHDGNYLAVGTNGGVSSAVNIYYFDKTAETLTLSASVPILSDINSVRWSHDDSYISVGNDGDEVIIIGIQKGGILPLIFDTATLVLNAKTVLNAPTYFIGECKVNGRGKVLRIGDGASLILRPGAQVVFEDVEIDGIKSNYFRCMTDNGQLMLRNCIFQLDADFTFSRGSILYEEDVFVTGTSKFIYSSARASTVASLSRLIFSRDLTFSYAPRVGKKNLLYMQDSTSKLLLNGCSLHSTRTGLFLDRGTVLVDNKVTVSSEAKNSGEAFEFGPNLSINVFGGATLDFFGKIKAL